jgi:sugar phosphate isomerase/epimerase
MISRRRFVGRASAAAVGMSVLGRGLSAMAEPLGLPLGLQLYSVRQQMAKDYEGTLEAIASIGYREVEAAGFGDKSAAEVKAAMGKAGLSLVSSHVPYAGLSQDFDKVLAYHKELGVGYLICSSPGFKTASTSGSNRGRQMTLEDWRWNAEQFNAMGEKTNAVGIRFGYHNHTPEFAKIDGVVPYLELLRLTDPAKVTMEMDCGWVVVGGMKPVDLLRDYPGRFSMMHVKDFKADYVPGPGGHEPTITEMGRGSIDYKPIFAQAAKTQKIRHIFIEQEGYDMPYLESLKVDADYMRALKA